MLTPDLPVISLGKLRYGKTYSFIYTLRNNTQSVVKIKSIVVGCTSCTSATTNKSTVNPEESTHIEVFFTPGSIGIQNKKINIFFEDESNPLQLTFTGVVSDE